MTALRVGMVLLWLMLHLSLLLSLTPCAVPQSPWIPPKRVSVNAGLPCLQIRMMRWVGGGRVGGMWCGFAMSSLVSHLMVVMVVRSALPF